MCRYVYPGHRPGYIYIQARSFDCNRLAFWLASHELRGEFQKAWPCLVAPSPLLGFHHTATTPLSFRAPQPIRPQSRSALHVPFVLHCLHAFALHLSSAEAPALCPFMSIPLCAGLGASFNGSSLDLGIGTLGFLWGLAVPVMSEAESPKAPSPPELHCPAGRSLFNGTDGFNLGFLCLASLLPCCSFLRSLMYRMKLSHPRMSRCRHGPYLFGCILALVG